MKERYREPKNWDNRSHMTSNLEIILRGFAIFAGLIGLIVAVHMLLS